MAYQYEKVPYDVIGQRDCRLEQLSGKAPGQPRTSA